MKSFIFGNSHVTALMKGLKALRNQGEFPSDIVIDINGASANDLNTAFFSGGEKSVRIVGEVLQKRLKQIPLPNTDPRDTVFGFSLLFHVNRVWTRPMWRKYAPVQVAKGEHLVSNALLKHAVLEDQKWSLMFIDAVQATEVPFYVIESPRLFSHHAVLQQVRPEVVVKVDEICRSVIRAELARRSVPVLDVPGECIGEDGFMLPEYRSSRDDDNHHGNELYGKMMMRQLIPFLRKNFGG